MLSTTKAFASQNGLHWEHKEMLPKEQDSVVSHSKKKKVIKNPETKFTSKSLMNVSRKITLQDTCKFLTDGSS